MAASRDYEAALQAITTLITRRRRGDVSNKGDSFDLMHSYMKVLDLEEPVNSTLSIIHVAGTKGKGSTCAFAESILRSCGYMTGLFTSPHLIDIRERFRINGEDVSIDAFLDHFWWCWDRLKAHESEDLPMPAYFRFITLLGFRIFVAQKVDVVLLEVGLGGRYDSTNVIHKPVVCGVSSLGYDHTEILGNTLKEIAENKAGIFKESVPAITVPQPEEAMQALQSRADELKIPLEVVPPLEPVDANGPLRLGLAGEHQRVNAALAVALCQKWLERTGHSRDLEPSKDQLPVSFQAGLAKATWPGRAQIWHDCSPPDSNPRLSFYLDGAHSPESIEVCASWFFQEVKEPTIDHQKHVVVFNCTPDREPLKLLTHLHHTAAAQGFHFDCALFVPKESTYTSLATPSGRVASPIEDSFESQDFSWQQKQLQAWETLRGKQEQVHQAEVTCPPRGLLLSAEGGADSQTFGPGAILPSLPAALDWLRECTQEDPKVRLKVLVTGSLHLVGDLLKLLKQHQL